MKDTTNNILKCLNILVRFSSLLETVQYQLQHHG